jgi:uncharacterized protein YkwD
MRLIRSFCLLSVLALGACGIPNISVPDATVLSLPGDFPLGGELQSFATGINAERLKAGVPLLHVNGGVVRAAQITVDQAIATGNLGSSMPGAQYPYLIDRLKAAGYTPRDSWQNVSAAGAVTSASTILSAWASQDSYRTPMLSRSYTDMGVAIKGGPDGSRYFVAVFAHP